ncbi:MAG: hypothetical protein AAF754_13300 [Pseudomonadota bacterium]
MNIKVTALALMGAGLLAACDGGQTGQPIGEQRRPFDAQAEDPHVSIRKTPVTKPDAQTATAPEPVVVEKPELVVPASHGTGQIIIYRKTILGLALQPIVKVGGRDTGRCVPQTAFAVGVPAGSHVLSTGTLKQNETVVVTNGADNAYVVCVITPGLVVGGARLSQVPAEQGIKDLSKLKIKKTY